MRILNVKLHEWFPPDDELATKMARICILREELMYEFLCTRYSNNFPMDDDFGVAWRKVYFLRKMFSTLAEMHSAIEHLSCDKNFKAFKQKQPIYFKKKWDELKKAFNSADVIINDIRNDIGAHVSHDSVKKALKNKNMIKRDSSSLHVSQQGPMKTHYKFVDELIMAVMAKESDDEHKRANETVNALIEATKGLFLVIDWLFFSYAKERKLL